MLFTTLSDLMISNRSAICRSVAATNGQTLSVTNELVDSRRRRIMTDQEALVMFLYKHRSLAAVDGSCR